MVTIGMALFVITAAAAAAYFVINSINLKDSIKNQNILKESIKSLEKTEQSLILTVDRLSKVKEINGKTSVLKELENLSSVLATIPTQTTLTEAVLNRGTTDVTFMVENSTDLTQLMASIIVRTEYQRIDLLSFSFNPSLGYIISLGFASK